MQDALEEAMRAASLRGTATDLAKFMNETFTAEEAAQRTLVSQAQRGELASAAEAAPVSGVAAAAAAEMASTYAVDNERTSVDLLPPPIEGSERDGQATAAEAESGAPEHGQTRAQRLSPQPRPSALSQAPTEPLGVPALGRQLGGQIPAIYYAFAIGAVLLIVLIAWLIAR